LEDKSHKTLLFAMNGRFLPIPPKQFGAKSRYSKIARIKSMKNIEQLLTACNETSIHTSTAPGTPMDKHFQMLPGASKQQIFKMLVEGRCMLT